jgi:tRNA pseudouridine38-40 synthase
MPRFKLTVAYDGTDFHGWQRQEPPGAEPLRTVQGMLEQAVRITVGAPVAVTGASRTDSGVHAVGQVAAFSAETRIPVERLALAISSRLPEDMRVLDATIVPDRFDPISDAVSKSYRYTIALPATADERRRHPPLFDRRTVWWTVHRLDLGAMRAVAAVLVGEHDFAAFAHAAHRRESTVRRIHACDVLAPEPGRLFIEVAGNGFLYNMVRIIAGTLAEAGRGRITPERIRRALDEGDRSLTGSTLPPHGLCLRWVHYGGRDRLDGPASELPAGDRGRG